MDGIINRVIVFIYVNVGDDDFVIFKIIYENNFICEKKRRIMLYFVSL